MTIRLAILAAACALLSACATPLATHQQTFENVQLLRDDNIPQIALGKFGLASGLPAGMDKSIGIRAGGVTPPQGVTFSGYLKQALEAELSGAGKLNPAAPIVLSGDLTRSTISTLDSMSNGTLGARFYVMRSGAKVFDKELMVTEEWPSAFFGFEAINTATNHYNGFYPKLVTKLLSDPEFKKAVRAQ
jgi:hypothetical protein